MAAFRLPKLLISIGKRQETLKFTQDMVLPKHQMMIQLLHWKTHRLLQDMATWGHGAITGEALDQPSKILGQRNEPIFRKCLDGDMGQNSRLDHRKTTDLSDLSLCLVAIQYLGYRILTPTWKDADPIGPRSSSKDHAVRSIKIIHNQTWH